MKIKVLFVDLWNLSSSVQRKGLVVIFVVLTSYETLNLTWETVRDKVRLLRSLNYNFELVERMLHVEN